MHTVSIAQDPPYIRYDYINKKDFSLWKISTSCTVQSIGRVAEEQATVYNYRHATRVGKYPAYR